MNTILLDKLMDLRLSGMQKALEEQFKDKAYGELSFDERFSFLIDREKIERENRLLKSRLLKAKFKEKAALEEVRPSSARGLDRVQIKQLAQCDWIRQKRNILITGPSGSGKTYLATALSHKACMNGFNARYYRASHLLSELDASRSDGRYRKLLSAIGKINVLIIDDFCLSAMSESEQKDLFELVDERHNNSSTIFTSQNPTNVWHGLMPNPAIADAVLDRMVHQAIRLELKGDSLRKKKIEEVDSNELNK